MPVSSKRTGRQGRAAQHAVVQGNPAVHLLIFLVLFGLPFIALHLSLLRLPFFWDELGQFIPTALDLFRDGAWVAHSAVPNIHPPGVEMYLVIWYKLFGYSIGITRIAMLLIASIGLLVTFLMSVELCRGIPGAPAFLPPVLVALSPLFFMQGMMAQLDMPAMVLTLLALLLFVRGSVTAAAVSCIALVLVKETGAVTPVVLMAVLLRRKNFRAAAYFALPLAALAAWLLVLHHSTGYWTGDPGFAHYNIAYSIEPVHLATNFLRRIYYLFFAEFRWIGTLLIAFTWKSLWGFRSKAWAITGLVCAANLTVVTVLGGAELERYLLPVLPVFYIVVTIAIWQLRKPVRSIVAFALTVGLGFSLFHNPPYPFPFENNLAMVDFIELQRAAAAYIDIKLDGQRIATAWPYTAALRDPDFGFVEKKQRTVETNDFHWKSVRAITPDRYDALVVYTRTWMPEGGMMGLKAVQQFLRRFYDYEPEVTREQCAQLGLYPVASWERRGQTVTVYVRMRDMNHIPASENSASGDHAAIAAGS